MYENNERIVLISAGEILKRIREKMKLTQAGICEYLKWNQCVIADIEEDWTRWTSYSRPTICDHYKNISVRRQQILIYVHKLMEMNNIKGIEIPKYIMDNFRQYHFAYARIVNNLIILCDTLDISISDIKANLMGVCEMVEGNNSNQEKPYPNQVQELYMSYRHTPEVADDAIPMITIDIGPQISPMTIGIIVGIPIPSVVFINLNKDKLYITVSTSVIKLSYDSVSDCISEYKSLIAAIKSRNSIHLNHININLLSGNY